MPRGYADTRRNPGRPNVAPTPASRQPPSASTSASSNLDKGSAEHVYDVIYCARGQAENLIKMHKSQLAPDRTSCRSPIANQMRLVLHTAVYWLMLTFREAAPTTHHLRNAEFATLRLRGSQNWTLGSRARRQASSALLQTG